MAVSGVSSMGHVPIRFQVFTVATEVTGKARVATITPRSQILSQLAAAPSSNLRDLFNLIVSLSPRSALYAYARFLVM